MRILQKMFIYVVRIIHDKHYLLILEHHIIHLRYFIQFPVSWYFQGILCQKPLNF